MSATRMVRRRRRRNGHGNGGNGGGGRRGLLIAGSLLAVIVVLAAVAAGGGALFGRNKFDEFVADVVPAEELIARFSRGGARVYDRHGVLLYEFVDESGGLRRPVPLDDITHWLIDATIATEDASFWTNSGLNYRGLIRAAYENFSPVSGTFLEGSGGSSITQQLARNIYIPREERSERTVERKLKEAAIAIELTDRYSKEQILEWYLNSISYGGIYVGVEAAAQGYFDKQASELTLAEAALLAGIPQQPSAYNPFAKDADGFDVNRDQFGRLIAPPKARQRDVLNLMVSTGFITRQQADAAYAAPLVFRTGRFDIEAAHFVLYRVAREIEARFGPRALYDEGLEVWTTLDLELQHMTEEILEQRIAAVEEEVDGHNGAALALDPRTGQILVYIGSRDYFREDIQGRNDNITALNSPGSALKPFTYLTGFMLGFSTGHGLIDMPYQIIDPATGEPFSPRNFNTGECVIPSDCRYQGVIAAHLALGNSLNTPAFKMIIEAGVSNVVSMLKQVGFTSLDSPLGYGPALTIGGVDITLEDITFAYSVLANEGTMRGQQVVVRYDPGERALEPVALLRVTDADGDVLYEFTEPEERRVVASNFAYLVTAILSDGDNQCLTFGVCGALSLAGRPSAVKTGTSEPFEYEDEDDEVVAGQAFVREIGDTWAVGYTPELVAGFWAGNADNSPMVHIFSTTISWRSWRDFMVAASEHLALPPTEFEEPQGIVERELCWPSGRLPSELCPSINRYNGLFAEDVLPRDQEGLRAMQDDWWQVVQIDTRTGLVATPATPSAFVSEEVRLVLPEDQIYLRDAENEPTEVWPGLDHWAARNGISRLLAPTEESSTSGALLRVTSPAANQTVSGLLTVAGRASSPAFQSYAVEWARAVTPERCDPGLWVRIRGSTVPSTSGALAGWDTTTVPNGRYTVSVVLTDGERGELRYSVPIVIDNGDQGAPLDRAPCAQLTAPLEGEALSGAIEVLGSAWSGELREAVVEFGPGLEPGVWTVIERFSVPRIDSRLARWETDDLAEGLYTLRVRVLDRRLGSSELRVVVTVKHGSAEQSSG